MKLKFYSLAFLFLLTSNLLADSVKDTHSDIDDSEKTVIEEQEISEQSSQQFPSLVSLYQPNFVLPFYHTGSPYQAIYLGNTPNNQLIQNDEFKAQLSFIVPIIRNKIDKVPFSINAAYTQLMYWQFYAKSQYFRETDYEPELFIQTPGNNCSSWQLGINHQSNGRGGELERSWNRLYAQYAYSGINWLFKVRGWSLIAKNESSDLHNPDIAHYLGYENVLFSYEWQRFVGTIQLQNIESGLQRGFILASLSYPIFSNLSVYGQFFNGYGQSLIEYNHKTTSFGIGIALNDWIN